MNPFAWKCLQQLTRWEMGRVRNQFVAATKNYRATQEKVLLKKIRRCEDSAFGRKYQFRKIRNSDDFRRLVPLLTYEEISPYIEQVKAGDVGALFSQNEKILMYALSSGTTATPKTIPVTPTFLKEYKRGSLLWGGSCVDQHKEILNGKILTIVSPTCEEHTPLGTPCGAISGLIAATQKKIARSLYPVPRAVYEVKETNIRDYLLLRFSLAEKLTFLTTANPSTLIRLARSANKYKEELVKDIYEGTLNSPGPLKREILDQLHPYLVPHKREGIFLRNLIEKKIPFTPRHFWPHLVVLACWKGGTLTSYLPQLKSLYGDLPIRDLGLLSSEGRITLPLQDKGSSGVLDILSHFFEFIPEVEDGKVGAKTLLGDELKIGEKYFVVMSTSSGLFRYQIHDLVQVEGVMNQTPILKFLNKGKSFSSITGEKLSEFQVVHSVQCAAMEQELKMERFILAPLWGEPPNYCLVVEENFTIEDSRWETFLKCMERELLKSNPEYRSKRESGRLGAPTIRQVPAGTFKERDAQILKKRTGRFEQYKPSFLSNDLQFLEEFDKVIISKTWNRTNL